MNNRCFVIMPFGKSGTDTARHFDTVYKRVYEQVPMECGYSVVKRSDAETLSGDIRHQVIQRLGEDELVIADLTGANPNVFYELGVRHTLTSDGTLLCYDDATSESLHTGKGLSLPFNVQGDRIIHYSFSADGLFELADKLREAILAHRNARAVDSPVFSVWPEGAWTPRSVVSDINVHLSDTTPGRDWLNASLSFPPDELDPTEMTSLPQRSETKREAVEAEALEPTTTKPDTSHFERIRQAHRLAEAGNTPIEILGDAEAAVAREDTKEFLAVIMRLEDMMLLAPSGDDFARLYFLSTKLKLAEVGRTILRIGCECHPEDAKLETLEMSETLKSGNRQDRVNAKEAVLRLLSSDEGRLSQGGKLSVSSDLRLRFDAIMDTFYERSEPSDALEITEIMLGLDPQDPDVLKQHARAVEQRDGFENGLFWHRASLVLSAVGDSSASSWLGRCLHSARQHAWAVEAFSLACVFDADDAENFARLANEIAMCLREMSIQVDGGPSLPSNLANRSSVVNAIWFSLGVQNVIQSAETRTLLGQAAVNIDTTLERVELDGNQNGQIRTDRDSRLAFAQSIYDDLKSGLTTDLEPLPGLTTLRPDDMLAADMLEIYQGSRQTTNSFDLREPSDPEHDRAIPTA